MAAADLLITSLAKLRTAKRFSGQSASYRKDNPVEYAKVIAYLDGGARPTGVTTDMGLVALLEEDARRELVAVEPPPPPPPPDPPPDPPPPPPPPDPPPVGAYLNENWETGTDTWSFEQKAWPPGAVNSHAQWALVADPFGTGQGTVLRLRTEYDPALPVNYHTGGGQRLLSSLHRSGAGDAHATLNEETWYRGKIGFPSGNWYCKGQWTFLWEWHTDGNTQTQGGNSPGISIDGGYPLTALGTQSPRGMVLVWRSGVPSSPTQTYWPNNGGAPGNYANVLPISIVHGRWYDMIFRVKWSNNASIGYLGWWVDGVSKVNRNMATLYTNPNNPGGVSLHNFGLYNYRYNITGGTTDALFSSVIIGPTAASVGFTP